MNSYDSRISQAKHLVRERFDIIDRAERNGRYSVARTHHNYVKNSGNEGLTIIWLCKTSMLQSELIENNSSMSKS
jgi:hypothetical protein